VNRVTGLLSKIGLLLFVLIWVIACDHNVHLNDVYLDGAVFRTDTDSGAFVDITENGSPLYDLSPMINDIPAQNPDMNMRYIVSPYAMNIGYGQTYIMDVDIDNHILADTVALPGDFDFLGITGDTASVDYNYSPILAWSKSDTLANYLVELIYSDNFGNLTLADQRMMGPDTVYSAPKLNSYGLWRMDVYAYHNGIYHPGRGHLVEYFTPPEWPVDGSWTAWIRHSLYIQVL